MTINSSEIVVSMRLDSSVLCDYILKQLKCINDDSNSDNRESVPDWEGNFSIVDSLESEEKLGSLSLKLLTSKRGSEQNMVDKSAEVWCSPENGSNGKLSPRSKSSEDGLKSEGIVTCFDQTISETEMSGQTAIKSQAQDVNVTTMPVLDFSESILTETILNLGKSENASIDQADAELVEVNPTPPMLASYSSGSSTNCGSQEINFTPRPCFSQTVPDRLLDDTSFVCENRSGSNDSFTHVQSTINDGLNYLFDDSPVNVNRISRLPMSAAPGNISLAPTSIGNYYRYLDQGNQLASQEDPCLSHNKFDPRVLVALDGNPEFIPLADCHSCINSLQKSVSNGMRHLNASSVCITLESTEM
ncbi:uncharacterized protein LOC142351122 isoform X2 [Convolutriloba macropyga]|uniref:uncharacterized protein LOC142351122 isoform X2 n=1 Tax=Convolutriloba macropyga TaxID=536237 RepID=UPI003F524231